MHSGAACSIPRPAATAGTGICVACFPIEINGSFYSLQAPSSWQQWHDHTPDHFVFAAAAAADSGDVLCYFDNDVKVHAPFDAHALMRRLGARVPAHMPDVRGARNALRFEARTDAAGLRPRRLPAASTR